MIARKNRESESLAGDRGSPRRIGAWPKTAAGDSLWGSGANVSFFDRIGCGLYNTTAEQTGSGPGGARRR